MGLNYASVEKVLWAVEGNFTWLGKNVPWRAKGYQLILTNQPSPSLPLGCRPAQATQTQGASLAAKVKTEVQKRGIGEKSRVKVRLRNKAEVKGYISKIEDASFDVTDKNTGRATTIPYADVEKVQGSGLSKGAKIGVIVGAAVVTVAVVIAVGVCRAGFC